MTQGDNLDNSDDELQFCINHCNYTFFSMEKSKDLPFVLDFCPEIQLENPSRWRISGHSKAGKRTGLFLKPMKIVLDAGLGTLQKPAAIMLTHSHYDHTLALPTLVSRFNSPLKGQESLCGRPVFMPRGMGFKVQKLMEAVIILSDDDPVISNQTDVWKRMGYHPFEVTHAQVFEIPGIKDLQVETLKSYHNTDSLGYGFVTKRKKLKQKYMNVDKEAIISARKEGEEITEVIEIPEIAFYCDSTIDNLILHDEWKKYPVILCECTGYPGKHETAQMRERFHTHLSDLIPVMKEHRDKQWVLLHASCAMEDEELAQIEQELRDTQEINVKILRSST